MNTSEIVSYRSFPCVSDIFSCGPSRYEFDSQGKGAYVWFAGFDVVAVPYRLGSLESDKAFFFRVLDKRLVPADFRGSVDEVADSLWSWRDESGAECVPPAGASRFGLATDADYRRIMSAIEKVTATFYASFAAEFESGSRPA